MKTKIFLISLIIYLLGVTISAEIAPKYYKEMQMNAPEHLQIKVLQVVKEPCFFCENQEITVKAQVLKVINSATKLSTRQIIYIRYIHFMPKRNGWVGPRPIPVLQKDKVYPAFLTLNKKSNYYSPAAKGASFESLIP